VLKFIVIPCVLALATLGATAPLAAQSRSVVSRTELDSAVLSMAPSTNQATVQRFLQDSRVTNVASGLGIRTADLAAGVSTMNEAMLSQLAEQTRAAERGLAGGDTVVISTTAIIIVLLVIILLAR
jgi:2-hydroxychromene-2-carboxylate isomerase